MPVRGLPALSLCPCQGAPALYSTSITLGLKLRRKLFAPVRREIAVSVAYEVLQNISHLSILPKVRPLLLCKQTDCRRTAFNRRQLSWVVIGCAHVGVKLKQLQAKRRGIMPWAVLSQSQKTYIPITADKRKPEFCTLIPSIVWCRSSTLCHFCFCIVLLSW